MVTWKLSMFIAIVLTTFNVYDAKQPTQCGIRCFLYVQPLEEPRRLFRSLKTGSEGLYWIRPGFVSMG